VKKILLILIFFNHFIYSQHVLVKEWDYRYGGEQSEGLRKIIQTSDMGFIWGGTTYSGLTGDLSQANWDTLNASNDFWIVKTDSLGIKQWDRRYGGDKYEYFRYMDQTNDGGYILGGWSDSDISGDRTQSSRGGLDYWIVKIDSLGNKQWNKRFGGSDDDCIWEVKQTSDGGYILAGNSLSGANGDRTEPSWGHDDYWIVKTNSMGVMQWDKRYGGGASDLLYSVVQTNDGGFLLGGSSTMGTGGDYSSGGYGHYDYWLVKIDSAGNKQWDKHYGGGEIDDFRCLIATNDGCYMLAGVSGSGVNGNKSAPSKGWNDYWIVKIDSAGSIIWDKAYGGSWMETIIGNVDQTSDNGFLIGGLSRSSASGDKSENNMGTIQPWIVKTDYLGNLQWEKTLQTPGDNSYSLGGFAIQTSERCFVSANSLNGGVGGYRTQPNWDVTDSTYDQWVVKFCDTSIFTSVNQPTSIQNTLSIFPNPFVSNVAVSIKKEDVKSVKISIRNVLGELVYFDKVNNADKIYSKNIELVNLTNGFYLLEVIVDGERILKKLVKQ
jgi:hypothetical protein